MIAWSKCELFHVEQIFENSFGQRNLKSLWPMSDETGRIELFERD